MDSGSRDDGDYGGFVTNNRDTYLQITLSVVLGGGAFLAFCILRTRWASLYCARKRRLEEAAPLPDLPETFFGWMLGLWRITEQQVLASAGLDAYVFLRFFKLAIKFIAVTLFFALVVIKPVHDAYPDDTGDSKKKHGNETLEFNETFTEPLFSAAKDKHKGFHMASDYLWMYLAFAYVFTALAMYLIKTETERIIGIRQEYLGSQSTITDRTIRLSGIPPNLRSEQEIKRFIEELQIGKVDKIFLCRDWRKLDEFMGSRREVLHKLEVAWATYIKQSGKNSHEDPLPVERRYRDEDHPDNEDEEANPLIPGEDGFVIPTKYVNARPKKTIRGGTLYLKSRTVDAIDYYEEKLRRLDDKIMELRKEEFQPMPLAFVTMDSVAACQMAVQAVLDPSPMQLIAHTSPAPGDVVWTNTYLTRSQRTSRAWAITAIIFFLTILWSLLLVPLATALNIKSIHKFWPQLADLIESHDTARSIVQTQLPTLFSTLLFVAVPFLYDWLANRQGMTSQGDVELSVISKNFFFVFFNYFVIFTILGVASTFYGLIDKFQDSLKDATKIANTLAVSLQELLPFYTNLVILQGVGLLPFRLLEFGTVALTPIYRLRAKTPRDNAEIDQTPQFYYGFYLPQVMLIFVICVVYSVIRDSWKVLLAGLIYFCIGGFVYKYQLLYAMENRQHSTGKAWLMICNRIIVALFLFQLTTSGQLALKGAFKRALAVVPLIASTIWFGYLYQKRYSPLMKFISLRSIERTAETSEIVDPDGWNEQYRNRYQRETRPGDAVDDSEETGLRYINPALTETLDDPWISNSEVRQVDRRRAPGLDSALNAVL